VGWDFGLGFWVDADGVLTFYAAVGRATRSGGRDAPGFVLGY